MSGRRCLRANASPAPAPLLRGRREQVGRFQRSRASTSSAVLAGHGAIEELRSGRSRGRLGDRAGTRSAAARDAAPARPGHGRSACSAATRARKLRFEIAPPAAASRSATGCAGGFGQLAGEVALGCWSAASSSAWRLEREVPQRSSRESRAAAAAARATSTRRRFPVRIREGRDRQADGPGVPEQRSRRQHRS